MKVYKIRAGYTLYPAERRAHAASSHWALSTGCRTIRLKSHVWHRSTKNN